MNNELESKILKSLSDDSEIPESVIRKSETAFTQIRKMQSEVKERKKSSMRKRKIYIAAVALFGALMIPIMTSDSAIAAIKSFFYKDAGIQKATDNGYVQAVDDDSVKDKGIAVKVDQVVVDKTKMAFSFQLAFDDVSLISAADRVFMDMVIRDDEGKYIEADGNPNSLTSGMDWNTNVSQKENGKVVYNVVLQSPEGKFVNMNVLEVDIHSIALYKKHGDKPYKVIEGNWISMIGLDEKFTMQQTVKYDAEDHPVVKVMYAEMLPTGMSIQFSIAEKVDESILHKVTLVDETGKTYEPSNIASMDYTEDGKDLISMTFEATAYDELDALTMKLEDIAGQDLTVKLVKSSMDGQID